MEVLEIITWVNCGPDCDNATARAPQTGEPLERISSDLGVIRRLSNLRPALSTMIRIMTPEAKR